MLAESADMKDMEKYLTDDNWLIQPKLDGDRFLVEIINGKVTPVNRSGKPKVRGVSLKTLAQFEDFNAGRFIFDGELVDGCLRLFDMVEGLDVTPMTPNIDRLAALKQVFDIWNPDPKLVKLVGTAYTSSEKAQLVRIAQGAQAEGVMVKRVRSAYRSGRRSEWLKLKFTHDLDAVVTGLNHDGKNNAVLSLYDPVQKKLVEVGRASTNGRGKCEAAMYDVWEVRYLYFTDADKRLYQPRLLKRRATFAEQQAGTADKFMHECLFSQLVTTDKTVLDKSRWEDQ